MRLLNDKKEAIEEIEKNSKYENLRSRKQNIDLKHSLSEDYTSCNRQSSVSVSSSTSASSIPISSLKVNRNHNYYNENSSLNNDENSAYFINDSGIEVNVLNNLNKKSSNIDRHAKKATHGCFDPIVKEINIKNLRTCLVTKSPSTSSLSSTRTKFKRSDSDSALRSLIISTSSCNENDNSEDLYNNKYDKNDYDGIDFSEDNNNIGKLEAT